MNILLKLCPIILLIALLYLYIYVKKEKFDQVKADQSNSPTVASVFNNEDLKEISKYAMDTYLSVPNDASLTNFYKLGFDENYNVTPKIIM